MDNLNPNWITIITLINSVALIITGGAALWRSIRLTPKEAISQDAQAALDYANAATLSNTARVELQKTLDAYVVRLKTIEDDLEVVKVDNEKTMRINKRQGTILKRWLRGITLLFNQFKDNDLTPMWRPQSADIQYVENVQTDEE